MKDISIKRLIGIALSVAGVLLALFALVYGAIRDTDASVTAKVPAKDATFIATAPGVLNLFDGTEVTITASAPKDGELLWAIGRSADVLAYIGESSVTKIDGMELLDTAKVSTQSATAEVKTQDIEGLKSGLIALDQSDLWEKSGREKETLELKYTVPQGVQRAFLATTTTGVAPDLTIQWIVQTKSFPAVQLAIFGILIALLGIYLLFTESQSRARINYFRNREASRKAERAQQAGAMTQVLPVFKGNLAAPETDRETQREHTEGAFGSGILPGTSRTEALRARELAPEDRLVLPQIPELSESQRVAAEEAANEEAQKAQAQRRALKDESDGALGAAILPGVSTASEIRTRELPSSQRVLLQPPMPSEDDSAHSTAQDSDTGQDENVAQDENLGLDADTGQDDSLGLTESTDSSSANDFAINTTESHAPNSENPSGQAPIVAEEAEPKEDTANQKKLTKEPNWKSLWGLNPKADAPQDDVSAQEPAKAQSRNIATDASEQQEGGANHA